MECQELEIPGLLLLKPKIFGDARGYFYESFQRERYAQLGMVDAFVQDNVSVSTANILRGLHIQNPHSQAKLVQVVQGRVFDVAVDVRVGSPTFGKHFSVELSAENHLQFFIPAGFAHGFVSLEDNTVFQYKCTDTHHPECEFSILWNDPELAIKWPMKEPSLSAKDKVGMTLAQALAANKLPKYQGHSPGKNGA